MQNTQVKSIKYIAQMKNKLKKLLDFHHCVDSFFRHTCNLWPDKLYISMVYWGRFHRRLNWQKPQSFNEKLNWEKVYNRNPLYTRMADKYEAKEYVRSIIGDEYIVPCYGVWDKYEDIPFEQMPDQFVLKMTHDSFGATICKDKNTFDYERARSRVVESISRNWYPYLREWVYKDIKPRIIIDKLLDDHSGHELVDYKFWCFNGVPKVLYFTNKADSVFENFYDMDFKPLNINHGFKRHIPEFEKPEAFELMKELASKLSKGIPFVRIDFFYVEGKVYFGECTFYDWAGMRPFTDYNWDLQLGSWIDLSIIKK